VLAATVATAALCAALAGWRLSRGPVEIGLLTPILERALSRSDGSLAVRIGRTELAWAPRDHTVELRARDVRLLSGTVTVVSVPTLEVELSLRALVHGRVAPREVELRGLELTLVREKNGRIGLVPGKSLSEPDESVMLETLLGSGPSGGPLAQLERIALREGQLAFLDRERDDTWHLRAVDLAVQRSEAGIALRLAGALEVGAALVPLRLDGLYHPDPARATGTLSFEHIEPAALAPRVSWPALTELLARLRLPVKGSVALELDGSLRPRRVRLSAEGGHGSIVATELRARVVPIERLRGHVTLELEENALAVEDVVLDLGGPTVGLVGRVGLDKARTLDAQVTVSKATTADLLRYWPAETLPDVRAWITSSLTAGRVRDGRLQVSGRLSDSGGPDIDAVSGVLGFEGVGVRLPAKMPPARRLSGTVTFDRAAWDVVVTGGSIAGLDVVRASVKPPRRSAREARVAVRGTISGPLSRALTLVDASRPDFAAGLGLDPGEISGSMSADVETSFAPGGALDPAQLPLVVSARLHDVSVPRAYRSAPLTAGDLAVELRGRALEVKGQASLAGAPLSIAWRQNLGDGTQRIDVSWRADATARTALGFDLRPWMDGPADVRASAELARGAGTVDVFADLARSALAFPVLPVSKAAGTLGSAEAHLAVSAGSVTRIDRALLRTEGLELRGHATLAAGEASVRTLDAEATLGPVPPARTSAHLALSVRPGTKGRALVVTSDDAGTLFHALGPESYARGGRLRFEGLLPRHAAALPFEGHLDVRDITITRAPLLARVATLVSLTGVMKSLADGGIALQAVTADIRHRDTTLTITDGTAQGSELALLVAGTVDHAAETMDMRGTLVPSYYGLNAAGARVPVIGELLSGSQHAGIQAFDFTVQGPLASPQVRVDPITGLAPGLLRDIGRRLRTDMRLPGGSRP